MITELPPDEQNRLDNFKRRGIAPLYELWESGESEYECACRIVNQHHRLAPRPPTRREFYQLVEIQYSSASGWLQVWSELTHRV